MAEISFLQRVAGLSLRYRVRSWAIRQVLIVEPDKLEEVAGRSYLGCFSRDRTPDKGKKMIEIWILLNVFSNFY